MQYSLIHTYGRKIPSSSAFGKSVRTWWAKRSLSEYWKLCCTKAWWAGQNSLYIYVATANQYKNYVRQQIFVQKQFGRQRRKYSLSFRRCCRLFPSTGVATETSQPKSARTLANSKKSAVLETATSNNKRNARSSMAFFRLSSATTTASSGKAVTNK